MINIKNETREDIKFLLVEINDNMTPIWHQVEMIACNPALDLFEAFYSEREDKSFFVYQVSHESLDSYVMGREIDAIDFCEGIAALCWFIMESDRYLLNRNSFLLFPAIIYVKSDIRELKPIYFPCKGLFDVNETLRKTISELVASVIHFKPGGEFAVATVLQYIKSRDFTLEGLFSVCDTILREAKPLELSRKTDVEEPPIGIKNEEEKKVKKEGILPSSFINFQFAILFSAFCAYILPIQKFIQIDGIDERTLIIFLLFVMDVMYYLFIKLKVGKKGKTQKEEGSAYEQEKSESAQLSDKTVVLQQFSVCFGYLLDRQNKEQYELSKKTTRIGRNKEETDVFCDNLAVGKQHAKLDFEEGVFWISDLNSKNGSYLNGVRLEPEKRERIKHGDVLSFANSEFIVYLKH